MLTRSRSLTRSLTRSLVLVPACRLAGGLAAWPLPAEGALWSRYAGAMLLHGFRRWIFR